jgi:hypothetical protein
LPLMSQMASVLILTQVERHSPGLEDVNHFTQG